MIDHMNLHQIYWMYAKCQVTPDVEWLENQAQWNLDNGCGSIEEYWKNFVLISNSHCDMKWPLVELYYHSKHIQFYMLLLYPHKDQKTKNQYIHCNIKINKILQYILWQEIISLIVDKNTFKKCKHMKLFDCTNSAMTFSAINPKFK